MAFLEVNFKVAVIGQSMSMNVILPAAKEELDHPQALMAGDRYPTLFLLHGLGEDHTSWIRRSMIERYTQEYHIAIVMPSTYRGWYTDMQYGYLYRSYIGDELVQICRSLFPGMSDRREDTYIAGNGMGGYGALAVALTYPETYSVAASMSGIVDPKCIARPKDNTFLDLFGPLEQFDGSKNDLFHLAKAVMEQGKPIPSLYMTCGANGGVTDSNRRMKAYLTSLGYDLAYRENDADNDWELWDREIKAILAHINSRRKGI